MPPKTIKKALADILEDLSDPDLEKFRHQLRDRRAEPRVPRSKVDGKSFLVIADVLVSTFTEKEAPAVAVEVLRGIGCHEDAARLEEEIGGLSSKPGPGDTAATGANTTMAGGGCSGKHFVDEHRVQLIERVCSIASILDELLDNKVIQQEIYDEILALPTNQHRMRKLYSGPLNAAGHAGKDVFYKVLELKEPYLIDELKRKK